MTDLTDLIQQVRWTTNMENSQFITDAEFIYYINGSMRELDDMLIAKNEDYRLTKTAPITISNNQAIPLPADFDELRGVDFYFPAAPQPWVTLKQFSLPERNRFNFPLLQTMYGMPLLHYMLQDGYVDIAPEASCQGTYRLLYTPALPVLVDGYDTIPYYLDNRTWSDYIVCDVAIKALNKQQEDPTAFMAAKEAMKKRVESLAGKRDAGAPKVGRNTRHRANDYYYGLPFFWR